MPNPDDQPPAPATRAPLPGPQGGAEARQDEANDAEARLAAIRAILALRDSGAIHPVTREEILAWRHEGHKY